ncbi:2-oxoglutarate and iron-dependent oxygenase domain-containing protein [Pseudofrankia sp. DC12]|uniref:2-oxoglutarate and iron-dependent oxygenase domain-containing protein n=1 Tax=Pseudofrankia sp. DC12 TaxID=683315 RepID=UPI0005F82AFA|nr:2-oxoglutarate and iron-dependent oxygenase domain-containing protein [Pseudofrankia sp. DC12]
MPDTGRPAERSSVARSSVHDAPLDLSGWWSGDADARRAIADAVDRSCHQTGFLLLEGHGVPDPVMAALVAHCDEFFALPEAEKLAAGAAEGATDFGVLTLLWTDGVPGLQIRLGHRREPGPFRRHPRRRLARRPRPPPARELRRRHRLSWPNPVRVARGLVGPGPPPDGDMTGALVGERTSRPVLPAGIRALAGELGHQVELRRPDVTKGNRAEPAAPGGDLGVARAQELGRGVIHVVRPLAISHVSAPPAGSEGGRSWRSVAVCIGFPRPWCVSSGRTRPARRTRWRGLC